MEQVKPNLKTSKERRQEIKDQGCKDYYISKFPAQTVKYYATIMRVN